MRKLKMRHEEIELIGGLGQSNERDSNRSRLKREEYAALGLHFQRVTR